MAILTRIAPWALYGVGAYFLGMKWASPLAALAAALIIAFALSTGHRLSELILDLSTLVYFVIFAVLVFVMPHSALIHYVAAGAQLFQGAVVGAFLLGHLPFTLPIGARSVEPEIATSDLFYRFNAKLSCVWLIAFLVSGGLLMVMTALGHHDTGPQVGIIALAVIIPTLVQGRMIKGVMPSEA